MRGDPSFLPLLICLPHPLQSRKCNSFTHQLTKRETGFNALFFRICSRRAEEKRVELDCTTRPTVVIYFAIQVNSMTRVLSFLLSFSSPSSSSLSLFHCFTHSLTHDYCYFTAILLLFDFFARFQWDGPSLMPQLTWAALFATNFCTNECVGGEREAEFSEKTLPRD